MKQNDKFIWVTKMGEKGQIVIPKEARNIFNLKILVNIDHSNYYLLGSLFMSYIMKLHGIIPFVDGCVACNKKKVVAINNDLGGFVCEEHNGGGPTMDIDLLRQFRVICKALH